MAAFLVLQGLGQSLHLRSVRIDLTFQLWLFLNHFLYLIFHLRQQLTVVFCVFWQLLILWDDLLKKWNLFLFGDLLNILNFHRVLLAYSRFLGVNSHFHFCFSRYLLMPFLELSIKLHLHLLSLGLECVELSLHGDSFFL